MSASLFDVEIANERIRMYPDEFVLGCESYFKGQIKKLVFKIANNDVDERIILIAGPSCAGKTTFSMLLKDILIRQGLNVLTVEMDNFFIDRDKRPRLPNGEEDLESLNIVNLDLMEKSFDELLSKKKAMFPKYDFNKNISVPKQIPVKINHNTIIILEGLHALNPNLLSRLHTRAVYKVFIEAETGFIGKTGKLSHTNLRMVRRMIRDNDRRNLPPQETISLWPNLLKSEKENIEPYKNTADFTIDSTHFFELGIYKTHIQEFIKQDETILQKLPFFSVVLESDELDPLHLPKDTLMWEFINKPAKGKPGKK